MKKYFLQIIFVTLLINTLSFPQWSTDPNNNLIVGYGLDPNICSDSAGGCYVTYNYGTLSYPQKLAVERLDKFGYKPWGTKKQILGELPEQWKSEIIEDGEGGVIVSYEDNQVVGTDFTTRVRLQRVDSSGNFLWGETGVRVTTEETSHGTGRLISDGEGGCVILWQDYDEHIAINRINRLGERVWGDSGIVLASTGTILPLVRASDGKYYVQVYPNIFRINQEREIVNQYSTTLGQMVPDPEGGLVVSNTVWTGMIPKLVSQRKDSLGNNLWQEPYVEIADSLDIGTSLNILRSNNSYHYGWLGKKNGVAEILQIQSLRNDGTKLFIDGSISLNDLPTSVTSIPIIASFDGSNIYAWTHWDSPQTYNANYARRIDTTGTDLWLNNSTLLNEPSLGYFNMTTDCAGGAIGVGYKNTDFAIRVLKVSVNGNLGEVVIPVELISFTARLIDNSVELHWQTATETNNLGFGIERKAISHQPSASNNWEKIGFIYGYGTTTETKSYSFIDEYITTGIYKYRLRQIDYDGSFEYSNEIEVNFGQPSKYNLEQNYPNPFNSSTIIKYQIPVEGRVTINLYNILGEKVKTLFQGDQIKGTYTLVVQSDELPSGHYFYSLESSSTRIIKKFTILK